jgi:replication factor C small subunit
MALQELWTEKYRPNTLEGYVFRDEQQKELIEGWINEQSLANVIFTGSAGIGKSTISRILLNLLNIHPLDILELNASRTNSVDDVRDKITNFIQMIPFGSFKVVFLDEFDFCSINAQAALRGLMEEYHDTARFIFTANYPHKIIPAIHSRCQGFHIEKVDLTEYTTRMATILISENIDFDLDTLDTFVKASYPDLRKCINNLQMNSLNGALKVPITNDAGISDYKIQMVELFKDGNISEARKLLCSQARPEEMDEIYRWLYDHLEYLGDTEEKQNQAILIIKQGLVDHTICIDSEINLSATLIRLANNLK